MCFQRQHRGLCVLLYLDQRLLVLLLQAKKGQSLMPEPSFLMGACAQRQASRVMATWMIPPRRCLSEVCKAKKDESWSLRKQKSKGAESTAKKSEALVVSDLPSCQGFGRMDVQGQRFGLDISAFCGEGRRREREEGSV